jgi:hypothetical protein
VADDWRFEPERDSNGNIVTYAGKWAAADFAGKREMLKDAKLHAAKNGKGGIYVTIETVDELGRTNLGVIGAPRGPTLLERGRAKGTDEIVDAEAAADEWNR